VEDNYNKLLYVPYVTRGQSHQAERKSILRFLLLMHILIYSITVNTVII